MLSLARDPRLRATSHLDERSGGFFALGLAKATGLPVVLACTSGTAAANYAPAVIEAHEARVPLLVLTADRPPELRDVGAGQTIDQVKLYGSAAKWYFEVDDHAATPERVRWLRQLACRAVWTALDGRPGAGAPQLRAARAARARRAAAGRRARRRRARRRAAVGHASRPHRAARARRRRHARRASSSSARARCSSPGARSATRGSAPRSPRSPTRPRSRCSPSRCPARAAAPAAIAHYDALLRDPAFGAARAPELVLRVGDLPTSKPLRQWLAGLRRRSQIVLDPETAWQDPSGVGGDAAARRPAHADRRARGARHAAHAAGASGSTSGPAPDRAAAAAIAACSATTRG